MSNSCCPTSYQVYENEPYLTIPLTEVKDYLNIPTEDTSEDQIITDMIYAVQCAFEAYTRVELTEKTFNQLETCWCNAYQFNRSPVTSIVHVKYYDEDGVQQTVLASEYFLVDYTPYKAIQFESSFSFPSLRSRPLQIETQFKAGLTTPATPESPAFPNAPPCLVNALMAHVSYLYYNRDCACDSSSIPAQSKTAYGKYKIWSI